MKYTVERTEDFNRWLSKLKDIQAKQRIILRLQYIEDGNFGDHESVAKVCRNYAYISVKVIVLITPYANAVLYLCCVAVINPHNRKIFKKPFK